MENNIVNNAQETVEQIWQEVKPKLRGWLHLCMTPLALIAGIVLILISKTTEARIGSAVFATTAVLLFGTSATYHRGNWSPKVQNFLKRMDHSNIFLIIAGTYTPFALMLLSKFDAKTLLILVWSGAIAGIIFRIAWINAPRWLYVPVYVLLGWVSVFYIKSMAETGGILAMVLLATGGALYTFGAVVYGTKRPNPSPKYFGFHEVFHALTILAFAAHFAAAALIV